MTPHQGFPLFPQGVPPRYFRLGGADSFRPVRLLLRL
jgi:hypothetical protein